MDSLAFFVLMCFFGEYVHVEGEKGSLSLEDASFCYGGLEVIYPELKVDKCLVIPKEKRLREKVSEVWKAPKVYFSNAKKDATYILVMVDPDAPRRTLPLAAYWRHWLVVDIKGEPLQKGQICGKSLTGKWDFPSFVRRYNLGLPVATVQFLTQNYND